MKSFKKRLAWISCAGFIAAIVLAGCGAPSDVKPEDVAPGVNAAPGGSESGERPKSSTP